MKILAFSDLHMGEAPARAIVAAAGEADLVIGAGDFCNFHDGLEKIMGVLEPVAHKAVYVAGNHESAEELAAHTGAAVLHGNSITNGDGMVIAGIGGAIPPLPRAAFASWDWTEEEARELLADCEGADILVSHSPPKGVVDQIETGASLGSEAVLEFATNVQPKLLFCGHVHDCWGQSGQIGKTAVHNLGPRLRWFEI